MLILQCILVLKSQSIDFTNAFSQSDIPSGEPVFVVLPRYFKSDRVQRDVVLKLKKSLYGQAKSARLWYEKLRNTLLERVFLLSRYPPCSSQNRALKKHFETFHTIGVWPRLDHIVFYFI